MSLLRDTPNDLRAAIIQTAERIGIADRQVEKDYWATETLRELMRFDGQFLFKGGTSLSKAYSLVRRFSEDVDLLLLSEEGAATEAPTVGEDEGVRATGFRPVGGGVRGQVARRRDRSISPMRR